MVDELNIRDWGTFRRAWWTRPTQLVTFVVPGSALEPTEVRVHHSGLKMVIVSRESIALLDEEWKKLGVYILLGPGEEPQKFRAYVGEVGKRTLIERVKEHAKGKKQWWNRALL